MLKCSLITEMIIAKYYFPNIFKINKYTLKNQIEGFTIDFNDCYLSKITI